MSVRIVWVLAKTPDAVPPLLIVRIQLNPLLMTTWLLTLFVLATVRSGPVMVTVLEQVLSASLDSATLLFGSTEHWFAVLGLTRLPGVVPAVTGTVIVMVPAVGITTPPTSAVQERLLVVIVQVAVPVVPPPAAAVAVP